MAGGLAGVMRRFRFGIRREPRGKLMRSYNPHKEGAYCPLPSRFIY